MGKKVVSLAGVLLLTWPLLGWSPFLDRLHRDEGGSWENTGVESDYIEWKITRQERKVKDGRRFALVAWKSNFRNTSDQQKRIWFTFQLLDKDGLVVGESSKGRSGFDAIYLLPKGEKVIEGELEIDKARATSAHKSAVLLGAEEVTEVTDQDKAKWRQLHKGMTEGQVRALLGESERVTSSLYSREWHYPRGGQVTFWTEHTDGIIRVDRWDEPRW